MCFSCDPEYDAGYCIYCGECNNLWCDCPRCDCGIVRVSIERCEDCGE